MFAFAVWDATAPRVCCSRATGSGKKPLYYAEVGGGAALRLGAEGAARSTRPARASSTARARALPRPRVRARAARDLRRRPQAARRAPPRLGATGGRPVERVLGPPLRRHRRPTGRRARRRVPTSACARPFGCRLVSDVPLGAFLSGGIDSSSVVAFMCELVPPEQVQDVLDRLRRAELRRVRARAARGAALRDATTTRRSSRRASLLDVLPEVVGGLDEPFADASILPTYLLSRFARETVTVALGGDGGDELLAGYPTFPAERVARRYAVPRGLHERVVVPLADRLPVSTDELQLRLQAQALPARSASSRPRRGTRSGSAPSRRPSSVRCSSSRRASIPWPSVRALYDGQPTGDWASNGSSTSTRRRT